MERLEVLFRGKSMLPTLADGDKLFLIANKSVTLGDIVVFKSGAQIVAHRMIGAGVFKGDRSGCIEDASDVMGLVIGFTRNQKEYRWGISGQPLKKYLAYFSSQTRFGPFGIKRYFFLVLISVTTFLSLLLTRKSHILRQC